MNGRYYEAGSSRYEPSQIVIHWMKIPAIGHNDWANPFVALPVIAQQSPGGEQYRIVKRA